MFFTRINKIKVFDNREGFLWLFNRRAEMRIYNYVKSLNASPAMPETTYMTGVALSELIWLPDEKPVVKTTVYIKHGAKANDRRRHNDDVLHFANTVPPRRDAA
jgi:hypothetical protein